MLGIRYFYNDHNLMLLKEAKKTTSKILLVEHTYFKLHRVYATSHSNSAEINATLIERKFVEYTHTKLKYTNCTLTSIHTPIYRYLYLH